MNRERSTDTMYVLRYGEHIYDYKKEEHPYNCDNLCIARYHNIQHSQLQCIYESPEEEKHHADRR